MEIGYVRVGTTKRDLEWQVDALCKEGIAAPRIYVDTNSGASTSQSRFHAAPLCARPIK